MFQSRFASSAILLCLTLALGACATKSSEPKSALASGWTGPTAREVTKSKKFKPGRLSIVQGPTSDQETLINVLSPRLKNYLYEVVVPEGHSAVSVEKYETVNPEVTFYKLDKIHIKGLKPNVHYTLQIIDEFRKSRTIVDERHFSSLDLSKPSVRFATMSCMADDWRFEEVIDPIWGKVAKEKPDLIILNGDVVYVDSFDFVERKKATKFDLWQRYIDASQRIPLYRWTHLIPVLATWDDHDFGTNDGDRDFVSKDEAKKLFKAFYGGRDLPGVFENGPAGVSSRFTGFGQRFYLMDNRFLRQPNKEQKKQEPFGHWGQAQHNWLVEGLKQDPRPTWIFNGNQVFNGKSLHFKEVFEENHPAHFQKFVEELKALKTPVAFSSGDIHFSEVMKIPSERLGFETYEITSSAMHSYSGEGWENPARVPGAVTIEFNFLVVESRAQEAGLKAKVRSIGLAPADLFKFDFEVKR